MLGTSTMVSAHGAEPAGIGERLRAPTPVASGSPWSRIREHYGKAILISAAIVTLVIVAAVMWRALSPSPGVGVVTAPPPDPGRQKPVLPVTGALPAPATPPQDNFTRPAPPDTTPPPISKVTKVDTPPRVPAPLGKPSGLPAPTPRPSESIPPAPPLVLPPVAPERPDPSPDTIRASVEEKLRSAGFLAQLPQKPGLVVKEVRLNGSVLLGGVARNRAALNEAVALVHAVKGVTAVAHNSVNFKDSWDSQ